MEENKVEEIKEETVEEEVKEAAPVEEVKEEVKPSEDGFIDAIDISDDKLVEKNVDDARVAFSNIHKSVTKRNKILAAIAFVVMMGTVAIAYFLPKIVQIAFGVVIVVFVAMFIYTRISRKQMDAAVGEYLSAYGTNTDSYVYNNEAISDVKLGFKVKPNEETIRNMNFVNDLMSIGSRDTIKGKISGVEFETGDASIKVGQLKDRRTHKTVFVGKVISFDVNVKDSGRVLMYLEGCGDVRPDALADVNEVIVDELSTAWKVYSSNDNYKKIFTKPMISALNRFSTDETMNDVIISITNNKFIIGLSYSDSMMIIPLDSQFKVDGINHYKKDVEKVIEVVEAFKKNSYLK